VMFEREMGGERETDVREVRSDMRRLIGDVGARLAEGVWEISHEAKRILTSLGEKEVEGEVSPGSRSIRVRQ